MILRRSQLVALLALPNSNMREEKMNSGLSCKIALCMQSLLGFRVPWAAFRFPKPRIPDSTSKTDIPDSRISIPRLTWGDKRSQRAKLQMVYYDETKQNGSKSTKQPSDVTLFVGMVFAQVSHWMFLTCEMGCQLNISTPLASQPITMPICIFNNKSDLFFSARKHSAFFAVTTVA